MLGVLSILTSVLPQGEVLFVSWHALLASPNNSNNDFILKIIVFSMFALFLLLSDLVSLMVNSLPRKISHLP